MRERDNDIQTDRQTDIQTDRHTDAHGEEHIKITREREHESSIVRMSVREKLRFGESFELISKY